MTFQIFAQIKTSFNPSMCFYIKSKIIKIINKDYNIFYTLKTMGYEFSEEMENMAALSKLQDNR